MDIDGTTGTDDAPWDFGGNWQYPVLQYGALEDPKKQRAEGDAGAVRRRLDTEDGGKTTVTATQDRTSNLATVVTITVV